MNRTLILADEIALPTTTVTTTELSVLVKWDGSVWRCYASGSRV
jgi:hypothetical protein